jgi:hypothetical protein
MCKFSVPGKNYYAVARRILAWEGNVERKKMKTTSYFHSHTFFVILLLGLLISGCAPSVETPTACPTENVFSDLVITMERTACHGTCPIYKLSISGDGTVIYEGQDFVQVKGKQTASLSPAQVQGLVTAFEQAEFSTLTDYTHEDTTDSPSVITSITINGKTKTVHHYYGDNSAPQELFDLESKIDESTNSKQWTGSVTSSPEETGVIVTFRVADSEQYKIRLTDPTDIEVAQKLFAGNEAPRIPNRVVIRGNSDVNVGYSWSIDPDTVEFADVTTEVCDGLPSDVEKGLITSDRYCPWSAQVIAIDQ